MVLSSMRTFVSQRVGDVVSATGPKDTFEESAQVLSPCEDDISRGLGDGRVEGRTGMQVERVQSEEVLSCEGYHNEGACDMLC